MGSMCGAGAKNHGRDTTPQGADALAETHTAQVLGKSRQRRRSTGSGSAVADRDERRQHLHARLDRVDGEDGGML
jgi:hypothetical protein